MKHFVLCLLGLTLAASVTQAEPAKAADNGLELTFTAKHDGTKQKYMVLLPENFDTAKPHDLAIALHGHGSDRKAYITMKSEQCQAVRDVAQKHEMILASPDYRGNSWMGPAAEADLLQLIEILKEKYKVRKLYLVGGSMGGTSVLIFTALHPTLVDGVSSQNGIANLMDYDQPKAGIDEAIKTSYGGKKEEKLAQFRTRNPQEFRKRSPLLTPEKFTMPVAITVGENDSLVPPQSATELANTLKKTNPNVLLISKRTGHSTSYADTAAAFEFVIARVTKVK